MAAQIPLIHIVDRDDLYLEQCADLEWFWVLRNLDWEALRGVAARYYEGLWQFNIDQQRARAERLAEQPEPNPETQAQATLRLVLARPTINKDAPALYEPQEPPVAEISVDPATLEPGRAPFRLVGRAPKCFFALVKAFLGMPLRGRPAEPDIVFDELHNNPAYARACGFTLPDGSGEYRQSDVPSLRKLEQFDQIMTALGLWRHMAVGQVRENLRSGAVEVGDTLVHDTTHFEARSAMRVVELPVQPKEEGTAEQKPDKAPKRKSQPRTIKTCRCEDQTHCAHQWVSADSGAGTVVKGGGKMYWGHKASTFGIKRGEHEVLLDAVAMSDGATHDSQSLEPHLDLLFWNLPELEGKIQRVLDDMAADDENLKTRFSLNRGIVLMTSINPRQRRKQTKDLPRGIQHIEPTGTPVCEQGYPFDFVGVRHEEARFLFRAPDDANGASVCIGCPERGECYRGENGARQVTIPFERLPWINPGLPELSIRFKREMAARTVIERLHKLMKEDYGDGRLSKRGHDAFQARLDKTLLAMHLVIAQRHR